MPNGEKKMYEKDTIVALATKAGDSAINIIKLSGERAIEIADSIFRAESNKKIKDINTYNITYGKVYDEKEEMIDLSLIHI